MVSLVVFIVSMAYVVGVLIATKFEMNLIEEDSCLKISFYIFIILLISSAFSLNHYYDRKRKEKNK